MCSGKSVIPANGAGKIGGESQVAKVVAADDYVFAVGVVILGHSSVEAALGPEHLDGGDRADETREEEDRRSRERKKPGQEHGADN